MSASIYVHTFASILKKFYGLCMKTLTADA